MATSVRRALEIEKYRQPDEIYLEQPCEHFHNQQSDNTDVIGFENKVVEEENSHL